VASKGGCTVKLAGLVSVALGVVPLPVSVNCTLKEEVVALLTVARALVASSVSEGDCTVPVVQATFKLLPVLLNVAGKPPIRHH
jgi:hypothetical protein